MKILKIVVILSAAATSDPVVKTWTFPELAFATGNNSRRRTRDELDYLEDAKYEMAAAYGEDAKKSVHIIIPSPSGRSKWTYQELAAQDPKPVSEYINFDNITTSEEARDFATGHAISIAHIILSEGLQDGMNSIEVTEPGLDISKWSINDLKNGIKDSKTHPELKPYLEDAYLALMEYIRRGLRNESMVILTPMGLIPHKQNFAYKRKTTRSPSKKTTTKFSTLYPKGWPMRRP